MVVFAWPTTPRPSSQVRTSFVLLLSFFCASLRAPSPFPHVRVREDLMSAPRPPLGRARARKQQKSSDSARSNDDPLPSSSGPREPRVVPADLVATQDELDWLLDGLPSGSSFQGLLELLFSNQGRRLVVQVPTTAQCVVDRLASLDSDSACYADTSARRAIACLLLILTMCGRLSCFTNKTTVSLIKRIIDEGIDAR